MWLLDTNICIAYLNGQDPSLLPKFQSLKFENIALCSVVKAELIYGAHASTQVSDNLKKIRSFFDFFDSFSFDDQAADCYGRIRAGLKKEGKLIGANDMLIASIALANQMTLITKDKKDFSRIAELAVEFW